MNMQQWFRKWIDTYCKDRLRTSTVNIYQGYFKNYINPKLGQLEVSEISILELQCFYNEIVEEQKISIKTINNLHSVIRRLLKEAVKSGLINFNPSDYIELPRAEKSEVQILEEYEIIKLKEVIKDENLGISILLALFAGLRLGEILGLKWSKVDFSKGVLEVTHSVSRQVVNSSNSAKRTQLVLHEPKTENSKRIVPLKDELFYELMKLKQQKKRRYSKECIEDDFVLSNAHIKPIDPRTIQEFFKRVQIKAEIGIYKFHALRHTFASRAIRAGASDKVVSQILGHANSSTTSNIYVHVAGDMIKDFFDKM
ncbi:site-specific integrase [Clostridium sp. C2-6-12]|uniref:tyrosine-type recombinase/integrase n=1 Tax=Clostridium sp. C2-6-12 TaxID=2698832 RepID=UPI0013696D49|nr:site-specific integrase [Clostridium sp. C2-6-12]